MRRLVAMRAKKTVDLMPYEAYLKLFLMQRGPFPPTPFDKLAKGKVLFKVLNYFYRKRPDGL